MDNWESWGIPLAVVSVLWGINSNLRGTATPIIESLLSVALLVLVAVGFCVTGWLAGTVAFFASTSLAGVAKAFSPLGPATPAKLRRNRSDLALTMMKQRGERESVSESPRGREVPYHDKERRFQVWLRPKGDPPPAVPVSGDYRLRWVEHEIDLVEKVRLFEAGFDDRVVEILKVLAIGETEELDKPLVFLCLDRSGDNFEFLGNVAEIVSVAFTRYERLREHYAAKLPDHDWQLIDREFALGVLGLKPAASAAR